MRADDLSDGDLRALDIGRAVIRGSRAMLSEIDGLTPQQCALVGAVMAAKGKLVPYDVVASVIASDTNDPPSNRSIHVVFCHIRQRRPDVHAMISRHWGQGYVWTGPYDWKDQKSSAEISQR